MNHDVQSAPTQRYTRQRELGRGASAVVELVYDDVRHTALACKRWGRASAETRFRLKQQYRRWLTVRHPNVVRLYELFADGDETCLTMEAVLGADVRAHVRSTSERQQAAVLLDVLRQLADALFTLHAAGIVHRDVKPSNVLVEADGRVVLLDGGFAWPLEGDCAALDDHALTCTIPYLAPECLQGALPSVESDWYGFGALAAELITGHPAFSGSLEAIVREKDDALTSLQASYPDVPSGVEALACALLQRDPRVRPGARIVQAALREMCRSQPLDVRSAALHSLPTNSAADNQRAAAEVEHRPDAGAQDDAQPPARAEAVAPAIQQPEDGAALSTQAEEIEPTDQSRRHDALQTAHDEHSAATHEHDALQQTARDEHSATTHDHDALQQTARDEHSATAHEHDVLQQTARDEQTATAHEQQTARDEQTATAHEQQTARDEHCAAAQELSARHSERAESSATADYGDRSDQPAGSLAAQTLPISEQTGRLAADGQSATATASQDVQPDGHMDHVEQTIPNGAPSIESSQPEHSGLAHANELARLERRLDGAPGYALACIHGPAGSGKTALACEFVARARQRGDLAVIDGACDSTRDLPYRGLTRIMPGLVAQLARVAPDRLRALTQSPGFSALSRMFPAIGSLQSSASEASEPQRRFLDGLRAFRQFWLELAKRTPVLLLIDDFQACDDDSGRLLQSLLSQPIPNLTLVLVYRADAAPPSVVRHLLDRYESHASAASIQLSRTVDADSAALGGDAKQPTDDDSTQVATTDMASLLMAAEVATNALALELAAQLYDAALTSGEAPRALLRETALAHTRAGHLDTAAKCSLALAHRCQDRSEAQQLELAAGTAWLRAGDEREGRARVCNVLRAYGISWPRAPMVSSALERARALLRSNRATFDPKARVDGSLQRFDALWTAAKELVLIEPASGDALSARALREALRIGDPSRLLWTLGYEAVWEANLGGAFLRKHAHALQARVAQLALETGTAFDRAYARSVQGMVAWFGADWAKAEIALRDALRLYALAPNPSAHERHVLENFLVGTLEAQGKVAELNELLSEMRIAAEHTGHVQAAAMCSLAEVSLPALIRDQPLAAIAQADAVLSRFAGDELTPLHFQHFVVTLNARLYAGHAAQASQQVEQLWRRLGRTYFLRLDAVGIMLRQLRARAALALARQSTQRDAERLCRLASKEAALIGSSGLPHAQGLEHVIDGGVAMLQGRRDSARAHCDAAQRLFDRSGMLLMRELARHAGAALAGDAAQSARDRQQSAAFFASLEVQNPTALVAAWFPTLETP